MNTRKVSSYFARKVKLRQHHNISKGDTSKYRHQVRCCANGLLFALFAQHTWTEAQLRSSSPCCMCGKPQTGARTGMKTCPLMQSSRGPQWGIVRYHSNSPMELNSTALISPRHVFTARWPLAWGCARGRGIRRRDRRGWAYAGVSIRWHSYPPRWASGMACDAPCGQGRCRCT